MKIKKINPQILKTGTNRYLLSAVVAFVWMLVFDRYDFFSQMKMVSEISSLEQDLAYYKNELESVNEERLIFKENREEIERFAREHYLMKKENEDLFLVVNQEK
jgi:cell division protein FtsB